MHAPPTRSGTGGFFVFPPSRFPFHRTYLRPDRLPAALIFLNSTADDRNTIAGRRTAARRRWACSAVGSAPPRQGGGRRFDPAQVHAAATPVRLRKVDRRTLNPEDLGSTPGRATAPQHHPQAVLVNSADTPVFQTGAAGSMPAGRSGAGKGTADAARRLPWDGSTVARRSGVATQPTRKVTAPNSRSAAARSTRPRSPTAEARR